jgi:hypothetical protein
MGSGPAEQKMKTRTIFLDGAKKIRYLYSMKDNFDKLFNVVLVLTVFSVILSVIVVYKAVSIL